jgi:hypothetical protein
MSITAQDTIKSTIMLMTIMTMTIITTMIMATDTAITTTLQAISAIGAI